MLRSFVFISILGSLVVSCGRGPLGELDSDVEHEDAISQIELNAHYFAQDGAPFFWLADDAWALHNRLTPSEIDRYLSTRQRQKNGAPSCAK